ncbi:hypothetical protein ACFL3S_02545 [Gemmatimonadota bacterium]
MTREERVEHAKVICRRITLKVGEISPKGLGHWDRAWDLVENPSDRFLDALDGWVGEDSPESRQTVQEKADALLAAWADAGDLFRLLQGSEDPEEVARAL